MHKDKKAKYENISKQKRGKLDLLTCTKKVNLSRLKNQR